jgi:hypothetical protein
MLTVEQIQERTAKHYGLALGDMLSRRKLQSIVYPRHVAMYLTYLLTDLSLPAVAAAFGVRHHGTVLYACRAVPERFQTDASAYEKIAKLTTALRGSCEESGLPTDLPGSDITIEEESRVNVWTSEHPKPDKPDWYWWREHSAAEARPLRVVYVPGSNSMTDMKNRWPKQQWSAQPITRPT